MKTIFVFRQGEKPIVTTPYNLKAHPYYSQLNRPYGNIEETKEEMSI
jgi:hypothetical protein